LRGDTGQQSLNRLVRRQQGPIAVDREGGVRLVSLEDQCNCRPGYRQGGIAQRTLGKNRRKSSRKQHRVSLSQRHIERIGEAQQEIAARMRAPGFEETQVPRRHLRLKSQIELTEMSPPSPVPQDIANGSFHDAHARNDSERVRGVHLPSR